MKLNRCTTYVIPSIAFTLKIDRTLFIDSYLRTADFFNSEYIFLLFRYSKEYLNYLTEHSQVEEITTKGENMLVKFKLNHVQHQINKIYLRGHYSRFPSFYKNEILNYYSVSKSSKLGQVLFKLPILKKKIEAELNVSLRENDELGVKTNIIEESYG